MSYFYVYGEVTSENGAQYWMRYIAQAAEDAEEAAGLATRAWLGLRLQRVEVFEGEPEQFMLSVSRY